MRIHHSRPDGGFASIPNETLRDEGLSLAARGQLAYLLSLPDGWNTAADAEAKRARSLRAKRGEGRKAMRSIYAELKNAGYMHQVRTAGASGRWATETHVYDRPRTDVPVTDVPETRTSVPPAETPEPVDNPPGAFSQVAPTYPSPGVGSPAVGSPAHRSGARYTEDWTTEDGDEIGAGDPIADKEGQSQEQGHDQEHPIANSQDRRVPDGPVTAADDAQQIPPHNSESPAADRYARASEPGALANGDGSDAAADPEEHKRRVVAEYEAWMREHPETAAP